MATLIQFDGSQPPIRNPKHTITQKELLLLRSEAQEAVARWRQHRKDITDRIVAGAEVEQGPFTVELGIKIC